MKKHLALALLALTVATGCSKKTDANASGNGSGSGSAAANAAPLEGSAFATASPRQEELQKLAFQALQSNNRDAATAALLGIAETEPLSELKAVSMLMLSELYSEEGKKDQALSTLLDLRKKAPAYAQLEFVLGSLYLELKKFPESEEALKRAIQIQADFLPAYASLQKNYTETNRPKDAQEMAVRFERQAAAVGEKLNSTIPDEEKIQVIQSLAFAGTSAAVSRALLQALDDKAVDVRGNAAAALAQVGTEEAIPQLVAMQQLAEIPELKQVAEMAVSMIKARAAAPADGSGSGAAGHAGHDHAGHDHAGHDHAGHDHGAHAAPPAPAPAAPAPKKP
jgi:tetratricopeptide (TPR) repeat protein